MIGINQYIRTYWIVLYLNGNNVIYFDSFGIEHITKETKKFIGNKNIDSIMCRYFCTGFIDFMLKGETMLDYTN